MINDGTYAKAAAIPGDESVHVVPLRVLLAVFVVLLALTFTTVAATWFDFGGWAQ